MQEALSAMNQSFSVGSIGGFGPEVAEAFRPGPDSSLVEGLRAVPGLELSDAALRYIATWPTALQRTVQTVIWEDLTRPGRVPITFAWTPGYDFSVQVVDVLDTKETHGGITVLLKSRYPDDPHPLG